MPSCHLSVSRILVYSASNRFAMFATRMSCSTSSATTTPAKPPTSVHSTVKPLSAANRQHVDKFLSTLNSLDKSKPYKNPEYFVFDDLSFYDYEMVMESKRLPQPKSKLTAF